MKSRTHRGPTGFTLIEIMIVVTIIALLSSIAVPSFIRARKRAQATRILDDLRLIDAAIDLYGIENSKGGGDPANWLDIQPYLKKDMVLYNGRQLISREPGAGPRQGQMRAEALAVERHVPPAQL